MSRLHLATASTPPGSPAASCARALDTLHAIGEACTGSTDFARRGVEHLPRLVGSDLTTLVVCDLDQGPPHRRAVGNDLAARDRGLRPLLLRASARARPRPQPERGDQADRRPRRTRRVPPHPALQRLLPADPDRARHGGADPRRRAVPGELRVQPRRQRVHRPRPGPRRGHAAASREPLPARRRHREDARAARPTRRSTAPPRRSRRASARCSTGWRRARRTATSRRSSARARAPSRSTSSGSTRSSAWRPAPRR